jgi:hypothetical protein
MKKNIIYIGIALITMATIFLACKGDDGNVGPVGLTGEKGTTGDTGEKGEGFTEALKNGNILVYLDGTRPDGIAFKDTLNFRFSPTDVDDNSYAETEGTDANYDQYTYVRRYLGMDNSSESDSYAGIDFEPAIDAESGDTVKNFYMYVDTDITTSDFKYFRLNNVYENWYGTTNVLDSAFTAYKYDASKGSVKYKFKFMVPANNNATGYDLKVSGVVDATVYQYIPTGGCDGPCREGKRAARMSSELKPVVKAEIRSIK